MKGRCNYGRPVALALLEAGVHTVEVPPQMTSVARRGQRTGSKTDQADALLVARIGARENDLPPPRPNDVIEDLRSLFRYRTELVKSRNQNINRLHAGLEQLRCGYHRKITTPLTSSKALERVSRLIRGDQTPRAQIIRQRVSHIRTLNRWIKEVTTQITDLVEASGTTLTSIYGVGVLTAAEILTEVGDPTRYSTKDKFAMANGTAPLEASSGRVVRHRLNRGGNRRLNRGHPHRCSRPDHPSRHRRPHLLRTQTSCGQNETRSHQSTQTPDLRPCLDPPTGVIRSFHRP